MEALDLPAGLGAAGAGPFRRNRQGLARVAPQVVPVRAAVVRPGPFDGDTAVGEPLNRSVQDPGDRASGLIVVDFGLRDAGVIVDDGIHERVAEFGATPLAFRLVGGGGSSSVPFSSRATYVAPAAAIGNVPSFFTFTWISDPGYGRS